MNIVAANFGIDPDIWGTMVGMGILLVALLVIPFVDRGEHEPDSLAARSTGASVAGHSWPWASSGSC